MYTLSTFNRRLAAEGKQVDVELETGSVRWLNAQEHSGENIGTTETQVIVVELKDVGQATAAPASGYERLGPSAT